MRKSLAFGSVMALALGGLAGSAGAQPCGTIVGNNPPPYIGVNAAPQDIVVDTTWTAAMSPICVVEPIFVQPGITLTIEPGVIVRGQPRAAVAGTVQHSPGAIIVTQGAKIIADGGPDNPIIMTTNAVDNNADGVCDDGNGDAFFDPHPGFQDVPAGCIAAGTCGLLQAPAAALFCDADPLGDPMEPLAADGSFNYQLWGGLVLLGRAPTNLANQFGAPGCTASGGWCVLSAGRVTPSHGYGFVEGLQLPGFNQEDAQYGGFEPHDTSGVVRYVSVRHGGDQVGNANELNGVTLAGVGDNTIFEFNEVYVNFDDGFEYFGGTVHSNHLVVTYVGDDTIDIDQGFTGSLQFVLSLAAFFNDDAGNLWLPAPDNASGNKMGELDGDDYIHDTPAFAGNVNSRTAYSAAIFGAAVPAPVAADSRDSAHSPEPSAYIANWTGIGADPDGANPAVSPAVVAGNTGQGVQMRHGFAGQVVNSTFVNTVGACLIIDTGVESTQGHSVTDHILAGAAAPPLGLIRWTSNSCDGSAALNAGLNNATGAANNGDNFALFDTDLACSANIRSTGGGFTGLVQEDPTFDPKDFSTVGALYDPRPNGPGADCGVTPRLPGLDRAANYRGAFPAGVPELWTTGWTTLNLAGVLVD